MDREKKVFSIDVAGRTLSLEVSRLAEQANAAVLGRYGDTTVLVTVVMGKSESDKDYLPLLVDYEEKFYAVGKMLGSRFVRREGRPSEEAILTGRIIDRVIRPLFDGRIRRDIQLIATVLSYDEENDLDFVTLMAASAALSISDIPWSGPASGVRVGMKDGELVVNPSNKELAVEGAYQFETFVAGAHGKINMIELGGDEAAEAEIIKAFARASEEIERLNAFQKGVVAEIGKPKTEVAFSEVDAEVASRVREFLKDKLESALFVKEKKEREETMRALGDAMKTYLVEAGYADKLRDAFTVLDEVIDEVMHEAILKHGRRVDGRALDEVRELYGETEILPRVHGSALFMRGNTQSLSIVTLAPPEGQQLIETIEFSGKRRFLLHYNFPPYSVGEVRPQRGPGRRDIGHGALAEKTLRPLLPSRDEFPYTIRIVSEILSSNGSSSMATVCAGSMALMDAGVPMRKAAAGIAMGIVIGEGGAYKILTDIQGPEDHHGDMDFKVAGTTDGVNAIQMDVKVEGVTIEMLEKGLEQARRARLHILETMARTIAKPKDDISPLAPRIIRISIDPTRIGEVIGPGGKVINGIIADTGVSAIDIEDDGTVFISSLDAAGAEKARQTIELIMRELEPGDVLDGTVERILEFGAIVNLGAGKSGMIHVSELKEGFVKNVRDVVKEGDQVRVKVLRVENGKTALSMKAAKEN